MPDLGSLWRQFDDVLLGLTALLHQRHRSGQLQRIRNRLTNVCHSMKPPPTYGTPNPRQVGTELLESPTCLNPPPDLLETYTQMGPVTVLPTTDKDQLNHWRAQPASTKCIQNKKEGKFNQINKKKAGKTRLLQTATPLTIH